MNFDHLISIDLHTTCPYKGVASYYARANDPERPVAWHYPEPRLESLALERHLAYNGNEVDIEVLGRDADAAKRTRRQRPDSRITPTRIAPAQDGVSINVRDLDAVGALSSSHPAKPGEFHFEPSDRHVRASIGDTTIVDSRAPGLVWEPGAPAPNYVFAREDVRTELLHPSQHHATPQVRQWYDLELNGTVHPLLAWEYALHDLTDYLAVGWPRPGTAGINHWYEEAEEVFAHPRDPYKRVDALASSRHVEVLVDGLKVADTTHPVLVFETGLPVRYYIPPADVDFSYLHESELTTRCPYKGIAHHWSVQTPTSIQANLAWSYPSPIAAARPIAGLLAFYDEKVHIIIDGKPSPAPHAEILP